MARMCTRRLPSCSQPRKTKDLAIGSRHSPSLFVSLPSPASTFHEARMLTRWRRWNLNYVTDHSRQMMIRRRRHRDDSISTDPSRAARVLSKIRFIDPPN